MMKPLAIALSGARGKGRWRFAGDRDGGSNLTKYNLSLFRIVTMNPPVQ
jgi:hypothetical protein